MRIGYLVSQYPAPSHTFIRREIDALRRRGVEVETFSIRPAESLSESDRAEEARTFYVLRPPWLAIVGSLLATFARNPARWCKTLVATVRHRLPGAKALAKSLAYFVEAMRLAVELRRRGVTHLHDHFANPASHVGMAATRYLGIGWSLTLHGLGDVDGPTTPLLEGKVAAARFVACVSYYLRAQAMRLTDPSLWSRFHLVRCGIETGRLPPAERRPPAAGEPLVILSVGRLSPEKGQLGLVEAFAGAVAAGLDARLVFLGTGPDEARVREAVASHALQGRVEFLGRQPEAEVLRVMGRAHLLVLPSFMEGLPVVLMEAMAMGLPVIAPAITGIPELVAHRETGLLFVASNWGELAARMTELARDPSLRARLAEAARARLLPEFDVDASAAILAGLFESAHRKG